MRLGQSPPPYLQELILDSHLAAAMLNHARQHGLPISLPRGMLEEELGADLHYGSNSSNMKEMDFVHQELAKQFQAGRIVFPPSMYSATSQSCASHQLAPSCKWGGGHA